MSSKLAYLYVWRFQIDNDGNLPEYENVKIDFNPPTSDLDMVIIGTVNVPVEVPDQRTLFERKLQSTENVLNREREKAMERINLLAEQVQEMKALAALPPEDDHAAS